MKNIFYILLLLVGLTSCTENQRAKKFGGTMTIDLPKGQKLVNITWKGEQTWYLTKPMKKDDIAETYTFHEKSSYGIIEGDIILKESK